MLWHRWCGLEGSQEGFAESQSVSKRSFDALAPLDKYPLHSHQLADVESANAMEVVVLCCMNTLLRMQEG